MTKRATSFDSGTESGDFASPRAAKVSRKFGPPIDFVVDASGNYKRLGEYETINGKRYYVVGPDEANLKRAGRSRAILMVYDIFGYSPQLIQGADILARGDTRQQYTVFVPDILEGNWADKKMFDQAEKGSVKAKKEASEYKDTFMKRLQNNDALYARQIPGMLDDISQLSTTVQLETSEGIVDNERNKYAQKDGTSLTWGIISYGWSGKVAVMTTKPDEPLPAKFVVKAQSADSGELIYMQNPDFNAIGGHCSCNFVAAAYCHPVPLGRGPGKITVPTLLIASSAEQVPGAKNWKSGFAKKTTIVRKDYPAAAHGFMAGRATYLDPYKEAYRVVLEFFAKQFPDVNKAPAAPVVEQARW